MPITSLPAPASLIASAPTCSPLISLGRYFFFCASLPLRLIWLTQRLECAPYDRPTEALAREISEDRSAKANGGQLGWFTFGEMDPAFAKAAFALSSTGELSQPVQSSFGWHVIRLEGRRPAVQKSYEEVRDAILAELRQKYVDEQREAAVAKLRADPTIRANREAIDALVTRVDQDAVRRAAQQQAPGATAPPSK